MSAAVALGDHAEAFARELTDTFVGVFGSDMPCFVAETSPKRRDATTRVAVHTENSAEIPLTIDGDHALTLVVDFQCAWDHRTEYLKVGKANVHVRPVTEATPLFRYEFVDEMGLHMPCAHLQIHAHRDEFLFAMLRGQKGKSATRASAAMGDSGAAPPRLSNIHFPLGGARMRPCVEDVLQMLIIEFGIDTEKQAQEVIDAGRARWRRRQTGAAVRDAPGEAVRVLRSMGYVVTDPGDGPAGERIDRLTRF